MNKHFLQSQRHISKSITVVLLFFQFSLLNAQEKLSMTFEDALDLAKQNSPEIRQARYALERSQENLNAQEASLKSRFGLNLEPFYYNRQSEFSTLIAGWNTTETKSYTGTLSIIQPIIWTDGTISLNNQFGWLDSKNDLFDTQQETFSNNLYLSYNQPIFTYNRTKMGLEEVELDLENASLNYQLQELQLEVLVAQNFFQSYQNKMSLQVAREDYQNRQLSYEIINNKVDAGLAAMEELYQAELDRTTSQSQVQNEQVILENSLDELKRLLGLEITDEINVFAEIVQEETKVDLDSALSFGLKNRMEIRQREIDVSLGLYNVTRAGAVNEFLGNISLSYGLIGFDPKLENVWDTRTKNQSAILTFQVPLYDWGERSSRIKAAEASVKQSKLNVSEQKKLILISIRRAYRNLQNQVIQIELARENVESAQLTYDINLERYRNGDLTSMDLNLIQNQLSQRKIGLVNAMINYKLSLLDLKIESLWDFEKNQPALTPVPNL
ncbi:MAG: TolC family protein [Calditrichia bacterium]|nr:TolC family protein [Calditrichia bacterium]